VGLKRYTLESTTGVIANYSHREVEGFPQVHIPDGYSGFQRTRVTTEAYEDFTLDRLGASEQIHLATFYPDTDQFMFRRKVGQLTTALWFVHGGERYYLVFQGKFGVEPRKVTMRAMDLLFPLPGWTAVPAIVLGYVFGGLAIASEYSGVLAAMAAPLIWIGILKLLKYLVHVRFIGSQINPLAKRLRVAAD